MEPVQPRAGQIARALQDALQDSRNVRHVIACEIRTVESVLPSWRRDRELFAWLLAELSARGKRRDAAKLAFMVAELDGLIGSLESLLETLAFASAVEEAFEAGDGAALARLDRGPENISRLERAYAETGNPLYVWDALSRLCVPSINDWGTPDCLLPGWCVEYLARAAQGILGLPPPSIPPEGGIAEQAPAVPKALGLSRQGWDAYAERRKDRARAKDAALYARVRALGIPHKEAMEAAIEFWGLKDERSVRHRLQRARRANLRPTKPAS